jgi:hypothetical protein
LAQRLRGRRRERIGDPSLDRTLRHRSCPERDRVAEWDGHGADATDPNQHWNADLRTCDVG